MPTAEHRQVVVAEFHHTGTIRRREALFCKKSGQHFPVLLSIDPIQLGNENVAVVTFEDLSERRCVEQALHDRQAWMAGQQKALETALNGAPLETSLELLVRTATAGLGNDTRAAFYLTNCDRTKWQHVVGMSVEYVEASADFPINPAPLGTGLPTHTAEPVITIDVINDAAWQPWRWLAERFDFRGYWQFPIHTARGKWVGCLVIYSQQPRTATARDLELVSLLTHTAAIIIAQRMEVEARLQAEQALGKSKITTTESST